MEKKETEKSRYVERGYFQFIEAEARRVRSWRPWRKSRESLCFSSHLAEEIGNAGENDKEDTTTWTQSENLGEESLV